MNTGKVLMIVNPISGRGGLSDAVGGAADGLRRTGCDVTVRTTGGPNDARQMARCADADTRAVVAVGGDGTVREVVEGLLGRSIPIVVMPGGTENLVARHFGMVADPALIVRTVLSGRRQVCDVGAVNDRHFLIMAGIGFDAEVIARVCERRAGHISHWTYLVPVLRTFWSHEFPPLRVVVDGRSVFDGRGLVVVGVMPCYAAGLNIVRDAVLDDGLLDVCILPCASRARLLAHVLRAARGVHVGLGGVIYRRGKKIRVTSTANVALQCDGDAAGHLPAEFCLVEKGAAFLLPTRSP